MSSSSDTCTQKFGASEGASVFFYENDFIYGFLNLFSGQSCSYSYIPGPFNWKDGRDSCINDGMDLAVMKDQETLEEVKVYVAANGW